MEASEEWYSASYSLGDADTYDIVFTRSRMENIGYESRELVNVERNDKTVESVDLWKTIDGIVQDLPIGESESGTTD